MKAILMPEFGTADVLVTGETATPEIRPDDLLVRVHAAGVNRADIFQREGRYGAASFGDSELLGLELAGEVVDCGGNVAGFAPGQRVFGIVGGGAYGEYVRLDHGMAMPIPDRLSYVEAAAIAEAFITAHEALFEHAELQGDQSVLVHAGGSGVGTAAIQLASHAGIDIFFTAGSDEKIARAGQLGTAARGINYRKADFAEELRKQCPQGVNAVIDFIGADYLKPNLSVLCDGGRLVILSLMGGAASEIDLGVILRRRLHIVGSVMKSRTIAEKRALTRRFRQRWLSLLAHGAIVPVIDSVFPVDAVREAHGHMEANANFGKIVLDMGDWHK